MQFRNRIKSVERKLNISDSSNCNCDGRTYEMRRTDLTGNLQAAATLPGTVCPKCRKPNKTNKVVIILPMKMTFEEWNAKANKFSELRT